MGVHRMRMYDDVAAWWPLLSPPDEYADEAADLIRAAADAGLRVAQALSAELAR